MELWIEQNAKTYYPTEREGIMEKELERLENKIDSLLEYLGMVQWELAENQIETREDTYNDTRIRES